MERDKKEPEEIEKKEKDKQKESVENVTETLSEGESENESKIPIEISEDECDHDRADCMCIPDCKEPDYGKVIYRHNETLSDKLCAYYPFEADVPIPGATIKKIQGCIEQRVHSTKKSTLIKFTKCINGSFFFSFCMLSFESFATSCFCRYARARRLRAYDAAPKEEWTPIFQFIEDAAFQGTGAKYKIVEQDPDGYNPMVHVFLSSNYPVVIQWLSTIIQSLSTIIQSLSSSYPVVIYHYPVGIQH